MKFTRRETLLSLLALPAMKALAQAAPKAKFTAPADMPRPESFKAFTDAPRLFLSAARLKLLRREIERRSLRWEQFDTLWGGNAAFPELGFAGALRYQIAQDDDAGRRAILWLTALVETSQPVDVRQAAILYDWCAELLKPADKKTIETLLLKELNGPAPKTLAEARNRALAAVVMADAQPAASEKALRVVFENFWLGQFIPALATAKMRVGNADALPMLELMHAFRDNLGFDLRETLPRWFKEYPVIHLTAHYPAPWPASENEYRVPADKEIQKNGPDLRKAMHSRAAELAMVAFDTNAGESQLLQGFLMNDRFLMRSPLGIPYEFLWANPYQPGLSYYHVPLAVHDDIGGQLFVRSSWEDDAAWIAFFDGQLQMFSDGGVERIDPASAREPIDIEEAAIFFARASKQFTVPAAKQDLPAVDVFIVGLEPGRSYHIEIDDEEMYEDRADPGGILFLPAVRPSIGVRLSFAPVT